MAAVCCWWRNDGDMTPQVDELVEIKCKYAVSVCSVERSYLEAPHRPHWCQREPPKKEKKKESMQLCAVIFIKKLLMMRLSFPIYHIYLAWHRDDVDTIIPPPLTLSLWLVDEGVPCVTIIWMTSFSPFARINQLERSGWARGYWNTKRKFKFVNAILFVVI